MKKRLARAVAKTRLYQIYRRAFRRFDYRTIEFFIDRYSRTHRDVFFIQVGANDGQTWDPFFFFVNRDRWSGVVIEPQKLVFEHKLRATYLSNPRVRLMNVAVDVTDGVRPLYKYAFSSSRWATGLASFDRQRLIDNFNTDYIQDNIRVERLAISSHPDEYLTTEAVQCVSFDTLLNEVSPSRLDFLLMDVEGLDVPILSTFPFNRVRPQNIVFELPPVMSETFLGFADTLRANHYDIFISRSDAVATLRE